MGGEPLCQQNLVLSYILVSTIKEKAPDTPIYIWTGYTYEELIKMDNPKVKLILDMADFLIDGPYIAEERDITLHMRGSRNQRIIDLKEKL